MHEPLTNLRKVVFVQFAPGVPRTEIWRALQGAATLQADIGKYVIGVSEDIDPDNPDAVFWSLAYRANPIEDVHIIPYRSEGHGPKSGGAAARNSTLLIDATQKESYPPISLPKREYMERARAIWEELGLPALTPQAAVARLFARRLGRGVGHLREPRRQRPMGRDRQGNLRPPPRRPDAGNAGEEREGVREQTIPLVPAKAGTQFLHFMLPSVPSSFLPSREWAGLKRFPADLNRWDSQEVREERVSGH